jgi:hypothetical protein
MNSISYSEKPPPIIEEALSLGLKVSKPLIPDFFYPGFDSSLDSSPFLTGFLPILFIFIFGPV